LRFGEVWRWRRRCGPETLITTSLALKNGIIDLDLDLGFELQPLVTSFPNLNINISLDLGETRH